jgi:hypothetical protein
VLVLVVVIVIVIVIEDIQERSILWNDKSIEKREKLRETPHVVLSVDYDYDYDYEHEHEHEHDAQARGGARAAST